MAPTPSKNPRGLRLPYPQPAKKKRLHVMSLMLHNIKRMARGPSGRIVIEVDPALKRDLHSALAAEGLSLKDWFINRAQQHIAERGQPRLPGISPLPGRSEPVMLAAEDPVPYKTPNEPKP